MAPVPRIIYMDCHATTPVDPRVLEAMLPYFREAFGNASSREHAYGWRAAEAVKKAREQTAALIGASPEEIVFTSGATESDNFCLKGVFDAYRNKGDHIVTQATEHKAVLEVCRRLERADARVTVLPVDAEGFASPNAVRAAVTDPTILVSIMAANNEIGTIQPIAEIGAMCKERGVLFHVDAAQAAGKIPLDVNAIGVDMMCISAHKMYGPKGAGAVYVRRRDPRARPAPLLDGGGHERGLRSGTLNVPGIVGLGAACEICREEMSRNAAAVSALRNRLCDGITASVSGVRLNGPKDDAKRLPGNLHLSFDGAASEALLAELPLVAVSSGAACMSAEPEPSHVMRAIGAPDAVTRSSLRFGLGKFNTAEEVDSVIEAVVRAVGKARGRNKGEG
jgi:cysteine desulfurase